MFRDEIHGHRILVSLDLLPEGNSFHKVVTSYWRFTCLPTPEQNKVSHISSKCIAYVCVCVYMLVYVHLHICVCVACMYVYGTPCMWVCILCMCVEAKAWHWLAFFMLHHRIFVLDTSLTEPGTHQFSWSGWSAVPLKSVSLCLYRAKITGTHHHTWLLQGSWGTKLRL